MEFDLGLAFLYFSAAAFWAVIIYANGKNLYKRHQMRNSRKFDSFIEDLKKMADDAKQQALQQAEEKRKSAGKTEEQIFRWRHEGKMHEVKIVIIPDMDTQIPGTLDEFHQMVSEGNAGKLEDLVNGLAGEETKKKMSERDEFRFSKRAVEQLRLAGMSPDELVAKVLKAAGRMD